MPYIALKPVKFDREYQVGETIPDLAVDAGRAAALEGMKLLTRTTAQETAGDVAKAGKGNTPAKAENAADEPVEAADGEKKPKGKK